ncbi:MAG: shikimate dehydrogenase [Planctomycetota bacterium]|jgi:shikimate dehydrogenase
MWLKIAFDSVPNIIMKLLGILGYPLSHSHSPAMINRLAQSKNWDCSYDSFSIAPGDLKQFVASVRTLPIHGFNVTIPHKQAILPFCDEFAPEVQAVRAANTILNKDGRWAAFNTDVTGFLVGLKELTDDPTSLQSAVILGAGGAARAVAYALAQSGCRHLAIIIRNPERENEWRRDLVSIFSMANVSFRRWDEKGLGRAVGKANLIVQATPVGTFPNEDETVPFPFESLTEDHLVYDLVYNPAKTRFLQHAENQGARIGNGIAMLAAQAAKSLEIWGYDTNGKEVGEALEDVLRN